MGAIFGRNPAVIDCLGAAVRSFGAAGVRAGTFVSRTLPVARRTVVGASIEIACRIVTSFRFAVAQLGRDVTLTRRQPGLPATRCRELIGLGGLPVPGRLGAIVGSDPAVVDGLGAAVRGLGAPRVGPGTRVGGAPPVARRAIPCDAVEVARCVIARLGLSVSLLGRQVTCPRRQPGDFTILGSLRPIVGCEFAVVDGLRAVVGGFGPPDRCLGTLVGGKLAVSLGTIAGASVEITGRVVPGFGFAVTEPGRDVTVLGRQPGFAAAHTGQLVGPGILEVLGGLGPIFGGHAAVVDGLGAIVRGPSPPRSGPGALIGRMLTVARRAVPRGSVEIAGGVVTRFGLAVTQPGRDIAILRGKPCLAAPHATQLVSPGILPVPGGLDAIFGCDLAIFDGLSAVVRGVIMPRRSYGIFARRVLTLACGPVPLSAVEVAGGVISRFRFAVTLLGLAITDIGGEIAVTPFDVALAPARESVLAFFKTFPVLILNRHRQVRVCPRP